MVPSSNDRFGMKSSDWKNCRGPTTTAKLCRHSFAAGLVKASLHMSPETCGRLRVGRWTVRRQGGLPHHREDAVLVVQAQLLAPAIHGFRGVLHDLIVPVAPAVGGAIAHESLGLRIPVQPAECEQRTGLLLGVGTKIL